MGICVIGASVSFDPLPLGMRPVEGTARAAATAKTVIDSSTALNAAQAALAAMGVVELRAKSGASGLGQVIAVVDTGVDPRVMGGPNAPAPARFTDWIDLTGEGTALPVGKYAAESGLVYVGETSLDVSQVRSRSGQYLIGVIPDVLLSAIGGYRQIYFAVSDPEAAGYYNTVTVDTDSDGDFGDELPLREFRNNRTYAVLNISDDQSVALLVSRIDTTSGKVSFGFDLNGHGTGLAALAAGSGVVPGVAPEAQIVAIKALSSDGLGDWLDIERGVQEAVTAKADVILVGSARQQSGEDPAWEQLEAKVASMSSHLVLPAGNAGPGAGTITVSTGRDCTVMVSGYLPINVANPLLDTRFATDKWYPMSSCGPDPKGNRGPSFSAPAVAAVPAFRGNGDLTFYLMEGTSVSAAYAAGAIASVRQTQSDSAGNLAKSVSLVTQGLLQGASPMLGVLPVEQGSGRIDVTAAWETLNARADNGRLLISGDWDDSSGEEGIWIEGTTPGAFPGWIDNYAPVAREVSLSSDVPWLQPRSDRIFMEPVSQRETVIYGTGELPPGFYSGQISADDLATPGVDSSFTVTVSIPHLIDTLGRTSFRMESRGGAAVTRQFFRVPHSSEGMALTISGSGQGEQYAIYNPDGVLVRHGALNGAITTRVGIPTAGLWQVCVFRLNEGPLSAVPKVDIALEGFYASNLGATPDSQFYLVRLQGTRAEIRGVSSVYATEWRHRSSFAQRAGRSTQLMLPDIDEAVDVLSVRFGTSTGSVLRAYLMYFDQETVHWTEVGRALTTSSGLGEIHLPNPRLGQYAVYIEAYGGTTGVYVEMDVNLLKSDGKSAIPEGVPSTIEQGTTTLDMPLRSDPAEPSLVAIVRQSDSRVLGILERPLVSPEDIPLVQISGGPELRTIRAWQPDSMVPVDKLVSVGGMSYQLSGGRVTAPIAAGIRPSVRTGGGDRIVLVPPDRP
jgi:hypothetical protein